MSQSLVLLWWPHRQEKISENVLINWDMLILVPRMWNFAYWGFRACPIESCPVTEWEMTGNTSKWPPNPRCPRLAAILDLAAILKYFQFFLVLSPDRIEFGILWNPYIQNFAFLAPVLTCLPIFLNNFMSIADTGLCSWAVKWSTFSTYILLAIIFWRESFWEWIFKK